MREFIRESSIDIAKQRNLLNSMFFNMLPDGPLNMVLCGEAGTGKSVVIFCVLIFAYLWEHQDAANSSAYTNAAAVNVNGSTLNTEFSIDAFGGGIRPITDMRKKMSIMKRRLELIDESGIAPADTVGKLTAILADENKILNIFFFRIS